MYIKFWCDTPYAGTDDKEYLEVADDTSTEELDEMTEDKTRWNAEGYEYLVTGWDNEMFDDEDKAAEAIEDYYNNCFDDWEIISKEKYKENT